MSVIGILGKKGSGKDTVSDYIVNNYNYKKEVIAKPLKDVCKILFDFNEDQLYGNKKDVIDDTWGVSPRQLFQYIGTNILREDINKIIPGINNNFWINRIRKIYLKNDDNMIISDVRFQNEVDCVHNLNGIVIKLERPYIDNNDQHISEKDIDTIINYDYLLINNGSINELYYKIDELLKEII